MDLLVTKPHINVPFEYAECDYNLTRKAHLNGYVRDHTYDSLSISDLILLSYINVIISQYKYNIYICIISARSTYKLVDKCEGFNKYVFLKNKVLMYIFEHGRLCRIKLLAMAGFKIYMLVLLLADHCRHLHCIARQLTTST